VTGCSGGCRIPAVGWLLPPLLLVARESKKKKLLSGEKTADGESFDMKLSRTTDMLADGDGLSLSISASSSSSSLPALTGLSNVLLYASHASSNPPRLRVPPAQHVTALRLLSSYYYHSILICTFIICYYYYYTTTTTIV